MLQPPTLARLHEALTLAGWVDSDATTALDLYIRRGTLAASDRVILDAHRGRARTSWITRRWGVEAGPVALLAYEHGIGGDNPNSNHPNSNHHGGGDLWPQPDTAS
jgi:hypothetical protein